MPLNGYALSEAVREAFRVQFNEPKRYLEKDAPMIANAICGEAILKYISENIGIAYAWAGASAAGPDPVVQFTAEVSLADGDPLTPSMKSTHHEAMRTWLDTLAGLIKDRIQIAPPDGFDIPEQLSFNPAGTLSATMNGENTHEAAWNTLGCAIVNSIKASFVNPASSAGTHGAFSGQTMKMLIDSLGGSAGADGGEDAEEEADDGGEPEDSTDAGHGEPPAPPPPEEEEEEEEETLEEVALTGWSLRIRKERRILARYEARLRELNFLRTAAITEIVVHCTGGGADNRRDFIAWMLGIDYPQNNSGFGERHLAYNSGEALFHFCIDRNGEITEIIPPQEFWAYHSDSGRHDEATVGIELINPSRDNSAACTPEQYKSLALLCSYLKIKNPEITRIVGHRYNALYYSNRETFCPGYGFFWETFANELFAVGIRTQEAARFDNYGGVALQILLPIGV